MIKECRYVTIDTTKLPIVVVTIKNIDPTLAEYQEFLDSLTALFDKHSGMFWVFDSTNIKLISSENRILAGNWLKKTENDFKSKIKGLYFIHCSFWTEMVLKAIFVVAKPPVPLTLLSDMQAVEKHIAEKYGKVEV